VQQSSDSSDSDVEVVATEKRSEKIKASGSNAVSSGKGITNPHISAEIQQTQQVQNGRKMRNLWLFDNWYKGSFVTFGKKTFIFWGWAGGYQFRLSILEWNLSLESLNNSTFLYYYFNKHRAIVDEMYYM
jgi:hypothetical protein